MVSVLTIKSCTRYSSSAVGLEAYAIRLCGEKPETVAFGIAIF